MCVHEHALALVLIFLIECSKRLFVTVYGVDLEHLFQLRHLGIMGKFSYVYQMTKFGNN